MILAQGGGNIGAWPECDQYRTAAIETFPEFKYVILSQSVNFFDRKDLDYVKESYKKHDDITLLLRDQHSFDLTQTEIKSAKPVLAPDMAFGMGPIFKYFPPSLDVIFVNRKDKARGSTCHPPFSDGTHYLLADWTRFFFSCWKEHY